MNQVSSDSKQPALNYYSTQWERYSGYTSVERISRLTLAQFS